MSVSLEGAEGPAAACSHLELLDSGSERRELVRARRARHAAAAPGGRCRMAPARCRLCCLAALHCQRRPPCPRVLLLVAVIPRPQQQLLGRVPGLLDLVPYLLQVARHLVSTAAAARAGESGTSGQGEPTGGGYDRGWLLPLAGRAIGTTSSRRGSGRLQQAASCIAQAGTHVGALQGLGLVT